MPIFDSADLATMREAVDALKVPEPRTILVHLNIEVPATDTRSADTIARAILSAFEVGSDDDSVRHLNPECVLAEEI